MRLFVAIELDEKSRRRLIDVQDSLRVVVPEVSFTKPDNLHLTLKFIGEFQEAKVPALSEALDRIQKPAKLAITFTGLDLLPERGPIRIIAAAVDGGDKLLAIQAAIEEACATQNIPKENRRYRPHITLARARRPLPRSSKSRLLDAITTDEAVAMPVAEFVLMQSKLSNKGSVYTALQHLIL